MTSTYYLSVLQEKTIDKVVVNNIKKAWVKEKEEKWARKVADAQGTTTIVVQKIADMIAKDKFATAWFIAAVNRAKD